MKKDEFLELYRWVYILERKYIKKGLITESELYDIRYFEDRPKEEE